MMLFKKGVSKTLTSDGTTCQFERGTFMVPDFQNAAAALFKVRVSLTKSGGDAALTAAQRKTFLSGFDLTLTYGRNQQHQPYSKVNWNVLRNLARFGLGSEIEGFTDSATGLARTIASTATEVTFYLRVPFTALGWQDGQKTDFWGVGPTQAKTMVFEFRRNTLTLPTNFAVSGAVTLDIVPETLPSKYDRWTYIPHYIELSETNRIAPTLPPGMYALLFDRTGAHSSTAYTDVGLRMDALVLYDKCSLLEVIARYRDSRTYFPAEADLTDEYELLWAVPPGIQLANIPVGKPVFEQFTQSRATMLLSAWFYPIVPEVAMDDDIAEMAMLRGGQVHVINGAEPLGFKDAKKDQRAFMPLIIVGEMEREADEYPNKRAKPGGVVETYVPQTVAAITKARAEMRAENREYAAAEHEVQNTALQVPGAQQYTRGVKQGSRQLDLVRSGLKGG
jgi:hypothetical protein